MALYRLRDAQSAGILVLGDHDKPETVREVRLDPKVTYNTDDPEDAVLLKERPGLFREIVVEKTSRAKKTA